MSDKITDEDKLHVQILLAEYTTLRAEILQRYASSFQLFTLGTATAAISTAVFNTLGASKWILIIPAIAVTIMVIFAYFIRAGTWQLAARIREIEQDVNKRAREPLLVWESRTEEIRKKHGNPELGRDIENFLRPGKPDDRQI